MSTNVHTKMLTYLEREVKLWDASAVGCLKHILLKVHVCDFVYLHDLLLVHLFECVQVALELYKRHNAVRAVAKVFNPLEVLHTELHLLRRALRFQLEHVPLCCLRITKGLKSGFIFTRKARLKVKKCYIRKKNLSYLQ